MRLRAALVGCGSNEPRLARGRRKIDELEIVGLADLDIARAKGRAAEFGLQDAVIAADLETLLAEPNPDLLFDVVVPAARHEVVAPP